MDLVLISLLGVARAAADAPGGCFVDTGFFAVEQAGRLPLEWASWTPISFHAAFVFGQDVASA